MKRLINKYFKILKIHNSLILLIKFYLLIVLIILSSSKSIGQDHFGIEKNTNSEKYYQENKILINSNSISDFKTNEQNDFNRFELKEITKKKRMIELLRNNPTYLNQNTKITFLAHSHKKTFSEGPKSPLITHIKYEIISKKSKKGNKFEIENIEKQYNLFLDSNNIEKSGWVWRDYVFVLMKFEYNESITIEIFSIKDYKYTDNKYILTDGFD
jgi:hypothetical protein